MLRWMRDNIDDNSYVTGYLLGLSLLATISGVIYYIGSDAPHVFKYGLAIGLVLMVLAVFHVAFIHHKQLLATIPVLSALIGGALEWFPYQTGLHPGHAYYALAAATFSFAAVRAWNDWQFSWRSWSRRLQRVLVFAGIVSVPAIIVVYGATTGLGWALASAFVLIVLAVFVRVQTVPLGRAGRVAARR